MQTKSLVVVNKLKKSLIETRKTDKGIMTFYTKTS